LEALLDRYVPSDARCAVPHARALGVLLRSIIVVNSRPYRAISFAAEWSQ